MSFADNIVLASLGHYLRGFFLMPAKRERGVNGHGQEPFHPPGQYRQPITSLSGGNQRKWRGGQGPADPPKGADAR